MTLTIADTAEIARSAIAAHNEWAADLTKQHSDRLRLVGILGTEDATPESLVEEARRLIDSGLRAIYIPSGVPPAASVTPCSPRNGGVRSSS